MTETRTEASVEPSPDFLANLREVMLRTTLWFVVACGIVVTLATTYTLNPHAPLHIALTLLLFLSAAFVRLPFGFRTGMLVLTFFSAAFLELLHYGTGGDHQFFLLLAIFCTSAFLGKRAAMLTAVLGVVLIEFMGALILGGVLLLTPERAVLSDRWTDWITPPPVLLLGAGAMIAVFDYLLTRLNRSHQETLRSVEELQRSIVTREAAKQALQESEERYRMLAENMRDVVFILDMDLNPSYISSSVTQQRGYTVEEAMRLRPEEYFDPETLGRVLQVLQEQIALEGKADPDRAAKMEYQIACKTGPRIWVESVSTFLRDEAGRMTGILGVQRDISERKAAEAERAAMQRQIQQMQKMESLGMLAGGIAHDFNNLLLGIMGNADLACMQLAPDDPVRGNLEDILTGSNHAASLCKQLLAYSGKGRFVVQPLELGALVREMAQLLEVSISKKIALNYDIPGPVASVEADVTQMRQVIMNLIINAADAIGGQPGTITVRVRGQQCDMAYLNAVNAGEVLKPGHYILLEISDTGCGMDEATQHRIFDPFFSTKDKGHGLGLAAVMGIVVGHGGALKVYSESGKGTSFKILLPASQELPAELPAQPAQAAVGPAGGTILVIDDDEPIRKFVGQALGLCGYTVLTAADGLEGTTLFAQDPDKISLVLLDMTMPVMSGEETFQELRRLRPDVKIIFSSGFSEQDTVPHSISKGAAAFIQKPYLVAELRRVIAETLESA
ncbi:MAG: response regulator [Candidatus Hydrogenedentes bacterium]|nr:response regulator [Candidatus Hydrogenedentota bacterium]